MTTILFNKQQNPVLNKAWTAVVIKKRFEYFTFNLLISTGSSRRSICLLRPAIMFIRRGRSSARRTIGPTVRNRGNSSSLNVGMWPSIDITPKRKKILVLLTYGGVTSDSWYQCSCRFFEIPYKSSANSVFYRVVESGCDLNSVSLGLLLYLSGNIFLHSNRSSTFWLELSRDNRLGWQMTGEV